MSDVKTFRAGSMNEALELVRRELGSDAVILHTRQVEQRRLLPWGRPKQAVEITAGTDVNVRAPAAVQLAEAVTTSPSSLQSASQPAGRTSAFDILQELERRGGLDDIAAGLRQPTEPAPTQRELPPMVAPFATPPASRTTATGATTDADALAEKLDRIQTMLEGLDRQRRSKVVDEVPGELFDVFTELIDADVEEELARELVQRLQAEVEADRLRDAAFVRDRLHAMVAGELRVGTAIRAEPGRRKVVALVGPTGVGKTTTIAKLAANFRLRDGVKMGLVTVDTYRIAAVEQLRTYAEIIDLPMKVVTSPPEMRRALDELAGLDLVLIDTAGRSPRDDLQIQELKSLLAEARCDEVHLVTSLTGSLRSIQATAEKFAAAGTTSLIVTKLDEAAGMGALLSVARRVPMPVGYLTTGQNVPDDIEHADVDRMARLVLGRDRLG